MGHRPPYSAVITLSVLTAHHWRTLRNKMLMAGVSDPMQLSSMHVLLDTTEAAILEAMHGDNARDGEMKRSMFLDRLYAPSLAVNALNGDKYVAQPEGFEPDDVESSFDAFAQAAR